VSYYASNGLPVTVNWTVQATLPNHGVFQTPWGYVDAFVNGTDVVCQISEDPTGVITDDVTQEILLRVGFQSRPLPPFYAIRFKVWSKTLLASTGTIDLTLRPPDASS
jgi:hypothetical protein